MNKLYILCDHGLGNRLGSLVGGLKTAELLNYQPVVCWPVNNWCQAEFYDLFRNSITLESNEFSTMIVNQIHDSGLPFFFISKFTNNLINKNFFENSLPAVEEIRKLNSDAVFSCAKLPKSYVLKEDASKYLKFLGISKSVSTAVNKFTVENYIDRNVIGIHIRKTDSANQIDENTVFENIKNSPQQRYFICSDDKTIEDKFRTLSNVVIFPKSTYVEKLQDGQWRDNVKDDNGRNIIFNMNRPKQAIIEAFIDMLILSKTTINRQSKSTFCSMAERFSIIEIF
jgi:hypothetical protein